MSSLLCGLDGGRRKYKSKDIDKYSQCSDPDLRTHPSYLQPEGLTVLCLSFSFVDLQWFRSEIESLRLDVLQPSNRRETLKANNTNEDRRHRQKVNIKFDTIEHLSNCIKEVDFQFHSIIFLTNFLHPFLKRTLEDTIDHLIQSHFIDTSIPITLVSLFAEQDCAAFGRRLKNQFGFEEDNIHCFRYEIDQSDRDKIQNRAVLRDVFDWLEEKTLQNLDLNRLELKHINILI